MYKEKFIEKYFFLGLLGASLVLVGSILFPFLSIIITSMAIAIILRPLYEWVYMHSSFHSKTIASLLTLSIFIIIIGGPLLLLGGIVFTQFKDLYGSLMSINSDILLQNISTTINSLLPTGFNFDIEKELMNLIGSLFTNIQGFFTATMNTLFSILLIILSVFYFLKDGKEWKEIFISINPLAEAQSKKLLTTIHTGVTAIFRGYILIALIQGILMGIGLALFQVPHAVLWGVVAGIASLIPVIGTAFVSIPAILYLLSTGSLQMAFGMSIWATILVGTIDNFLNPYIVGKKTALPPLAVLFSILGGLALMGPVGILVGPLSVSVFRALVLMYREDMHV